jgi:hypothetical protein
MITITVDITECLYYSIPIMVIYIIIYNMLWYEFNSKYIERSNLDKALYHFFCFLITVLFSLIYFGILHFILSHNFKLQL